MCVCGMFYVMFIGYLLRVIFFIFTGTLMGIANTISNLSGFLAPQVVGSLTEEHVSN